MRTAVVGIAAAASLGCGVAQAAPAGPVGPVVSTASVAPVEQDETGTSTGPEGRADRGRDDSKPRKSAGFVPVRELPYGVAAMVAPAKGELWLLEGNAASGLTLQHLKSGRWTSQEVASAGERNGREELAATARDDVWLSLAGKLRHYDGSTWSNVALPPGPDGTPVSAGVLATVARGTLYVAAQARSWPAGGHILRYANGAWTDLGSVGGSSTARFVVRAVVAVDDGVSVLVDWQRGSTV